MTNTLEVHGGSSENFNENAFARPIDYAKTLKLRFRVGDLERSERRKRYTSCRGEEGKNAQMCTCGIAAE